MKKDQKGVFLSIIIPVYNVQKYLEQCVDSIINQKQDDIEIILVDDGSTDQSGLLCDKFAKECSFVKTVHQENQGLGYARNTGYRNASGKYIWYVDGDDYIIDNAIEWLKEKLTVELDVLLFLATSFSDDAEIDTHYKRKHNLEQITTGREYIEKSLRNDEYVTSVCLRVYRRRLLEENNMMFGKEELHEDELYSFISLLYANKVMATDISLYMRRYRKGSKMIAAGDSSEESFLKHYIGYNSAIDGLLKTYELHRDDDLTVDLIFRQISKYYQLIFGKYLLLDKMSKKRNKGLISNVNNKLNEYSKRLSTIAIIMINAPHVYMLYKKIKNSFWVKRL